MKELSIEQMEAETGGNTKKAIGCAVASALLVTAFLGAFALTAGASTIALIAVVSDLTLSPTAWGIECFT